LHVPEHYDGNHVLAHFLSTMMARAAQSLLVRPLTGVCIIHASSDSLPGSRSQVEALARV
jgi:hypothetical protein